MQGNGTQPAGIDFEAVGAYMARLMRKWLGAAVALARERRSRAVECEGLCALGELCLRKGAKADARRALEQAVRLSSGAGDGEAEARARYFLGSLFEGDDPERAGREFDASRALGESAGSPTALALAFYGRGRLEEKAGRIGRARYYKERALKLLDKTDEKTTTLKLLISLGANSFAMRDSASAVDYFSRAVALSRETGNLPMEGVGLANLGGAYIEKPDLMAAASALESAKDILAGIQDDKMLVRVHNNLSLIGCLRGRFDEAVGHAEAGVEVAARLDDARSMAKAHAFLGTALAGAGRTGDAKAAFERGASLAAEAGDMALQKEIMKEFSIAGRAVRG